MTQPFDLPGYLETRRRVVDQALRDYLPKPTEWPERLHEA
ncbi:polyprenyl synthetase family protein, partial [bacterium]